MKKYGMFACSLILLLTLLVVPINAQNNQKIETVQAKVSLPMISAGNNQIVTQPVGTDLIIAGNQVTIISEVSGDAYVAGGNVTISGTIDQDLIVAGGTVTISGKIGKNLIMAGGEVKMESGSNVGGYVLTAGNTINLDGQYSGPVKVAGNTLNVNDQAAIAGNLEADVANANVSTTAKIVGEKKINIHQVETPKNRAPAAGGPAAFGFINFLSKLVILLILTRLFGFLIKPATELLKSIWSNLGWGFIVLITIPFLTLVLLVTIIGIPLAGIIFVLYLITLYLSDLIVAGALGKWIVEKGWIKTDNLYLQAILGFVVLTIIGLIPFLGWIFRFIILLLGLGILFNLIRTRTSAIKPTI